MKNIVYVMINEAMPGYVKIGITDDLQQRLRDLYKTSVPLPFECRYSHTRWRHSGTHGVRSDVRK